MRDFAETWLELRKGLATYEAAAILGQWEICLETAADLRLLATELLLFAKGKSSAQ